MLCEKGAYCMDGFDQAFPEFSFGKPSDHSVGDLLPSLGLNFTVDSFVTQDVEFAVFKKQEQQHSIPLPGLRHAKMMELAPCKLFDARRPLSA
jgi:hypothetical protein